MQTYPLPLKFLFWDNRLCEKMSGFTRIPGEPKKYDENPVLKPKHPYEFRRVHLYGSVHRDDLTGNFRLWYSTHGTEGGERHSRLCHAESSDGIHWSRPDYDIVEGTNILLDRDHGVHGPSVIIDHSEERPEWRYKMLMKPSSSRSDFNGLVGYRSADGIHWELVRDHELLKVHSDCHIGLTRHPRTGRYIATVRVATSRRVWVTESDDFLHWTRPILVFEPGPEDSINLECYSMPFFSYGPYFIGQLNAFRTDPLERTRRKSSGPLDIALTYSRNDPYCWHWMHKGRPFIKPGSSESWDSGSLYPASAPVFLKDEIRFYYSASPKGHGDFNPQTDLESIGFASLPPDRFVGLKADSTGELLSQPFALHEGEQGIFANFQTEAGGSVHVGITDVEGNEIEGFMVRESIPLTGDRLAAKAKWKGHPDWERLTGEPIRLKVEVKKGSLYALSIGEHRSYLDFCEIPAIKPPFWEFRGDPF